MGLSWAVGMGLLVLLLEGVGVDVVEVVEAPPFMLRSVGPVERERQGEGEQTPCLAPGRCHHPSHCPGSLLWVRHLGLRPWSALESCTPSTYLAGMGPGTSR